MLSRIYERLLGGASESRQLTSPRGRTIRLQLEALESRNLLSASFGVFLVDFSDAAFVSKSDHRPEIEFVNASPPEAGFARGEHDPHFAAPQFFAIGQQGLQGKSLPGPRYFVNSPLRVGGRQMATLAPESQTASQTPSPAPPENFAQAPDRLRPPPPFRPHLDSLIASASPATQSQGDISVRAVATAYQSAFAEYAPDDLLLFVTTSPGSQIGAHQEADHGAGQQKDSDQLGNFEPIESNQSTVSLDDAVRRELEAIDEILTRLHDPRQHPDANARSEEGDGDSTENSQTDDLASENADTISQQAEAVDQGMILLAAAGDPNGNDLDLVALIDNSSAFVESILGVEATVGLHQSFDVATDESLIEPAALPVLPVTLKEGEQDAARQPVNAALGRTAFSLGSIAIAGLLLRKVHSRVNQETSPTVTRTVTSKK